MGPNTWLFLRVRVSLKFLIFLHGQIVMKRVKSKTKISSLIFNSQKHLVIKSLSDPRSSPKSDPAGAFSKPAFQISDLQTAAFSKNTSNFQKNMSPVKFNASEKTRTFLIPVRRKSIVCQRKFTSWSSFLFTVQNIDSISIFTGKRKCET